MAPMGFRPWHLGAGEGHPGFSGDASGKEPACQPRRRKRLGFDPWVGEIPGSGRSLGGEHSNPPQYSSLGNPRDRGAWQAMVHRVTELDTTEVTQHTHTRDIRD